MMDMSFNSSCREYTLSRNHRNSEIKLWIQKEIGPVLDVRIICHPEVHHGLEIQISSTHLKTMFGLSYPEIRGCVTIQRSRDFLEKADYECMTCRTRNKSDHTIGNVR